MKIRGFECPNALALDNIRARYLRTHHTVQSAPPTTAENLSNSLDATYSLLVRVQQTAPGDFMEPWQGDLSFTAPPALQQVRFR